jgi:two-component system NarL family response regulator
MPAGGAAARPIRVLVVDDHPIVRQGIVSLFVDEPDIEVVGEAGSGEEAVTAFGTLRPDVTLMDLRLPGMSGVEAIRAIRGEHPAARFIVLTTYDGDEDIHRALEAGARAYVLKDMFCDEILDTVRAVHAGLRRIPEAVARRLEERLPGPDLSPRELDVLRHIARGESNKEIAAALGITEGTVKTHVVNILGKLGVGDRTAAATAAIQRGIIRL